MTTLTDPTFPPTASTSRHGLRLVDAGARMWRVVDRAGRIVGHVRTSPDAEARQFHALRYSARLTRFFELGRFWTLDDAVSCLHYAR
ncbi:hypothetical protein QSU92_00390 [Microbacterium sp. ET2]|uniref:hypothetical protein n=1 Tax=Microbacterium albipurpureum TaxID=3050384 RepID=UPI00259D22BE|nr:hypothetical protein [Microbacterium sp. ET2 (Ac-2212)]WJL95732.1 hypothetical protein QSU92_00390 [Microbacterium sp. ET2 (Ac-2212)]